MGSDLITMRRVIFVPNVDIKEELKKTSINITCYDRNGEVVKRVTSSDDAEIEDNDGGDDNPGGGGGSQSNQNENENQNGQSGSNTNGTNGSNSGSGSGNSGSVTPSQPTVNAPSFSGATQFDETTQVTMSGPTGSEIHYTVDGSTPTTESTLYESPITLSETTTIKAIAIKDGISSAVTSRTYTKGVNAGGEDEPGGDDH